MCAEFEKCAPEGVHMGNIKDTVGTNMITIAIDLTRQDRVSTSTSDKGAMVVCTTLLR